MKLLLYCTKSKPYLIYEECDYDYNDMSLSFHGFSCVNKEYINDYEINSIYNGKIIAECDFEVEEIELNEYDDYNYSIYSGMYFETKTLQEEELCKQSCLTADELDKYLDLYKEKEIYGYANHIKNLKLFDKPKELSEFYKIIKVDDADFNENDYKYVPIEKAPQNMMIVYDRFGNKYILVSFHPESLCDILNGKKLVDVRKVVLKEMLK